MDKTKNIAIVGGGMLGMTLAYRLSKMGHNITLFEAGAELGGLAGSWELGDYRWDRFYHVISNTDSHLLGLLDELGLRSSVRWVETKTGFYSGGKLYSMSDIFEFLSFPPLDLISKFRLGLTIFAASRIKNWERLEGIPLEVWLTRWSGKKTFRLIWEPLLKAKLGESYRLASATFIWATIQRMYKARKSGLKKEMFGYVPGGYHTIVSKFREKLHGSRVVVKTGQQVRSVKKMTDGMLSVTTDHADTGSFETVVLTIPSHIASEICVDLSREEKEVHRKIRYLGVVCPSLLLKKPLSPFYVTNITDPGFPFTGIIEMTALVDLQEFKGNSLVYLPKYALPEDPVFDLDEKEISKAFIEGLRKAHPGLAGDDILFTGVSKARFVFALPTLRYSKNLPDPLTSVPGLFILNSAHIVNGTLNVNQTIQLAEDHMKLFNDTFH